MKYNEDIKRTYTVLLMAFIGFSFLVCVNFVDSAAAQEANAIVKAMSAYLASQESITFDFDTGLEVITPQSQKLQFNSSGNVAISRPDRFRLRRTGGYVDVELIADGKTLTVFGHNINKYAQIEAARSFDQTIDMLRDKYMLDLPAADFFLADPYAALMENVIEAAHIGRGVIDGVECEHLAFRGLETDWQLWVEVGAKPIPRKYVITSKTVAGAPQYTIRFKNWKTGVSFAPDAFTFTAPSNAQKVTIEQLPHLDEIPESAPLGGEK